jgi:uncharacterized delta-60 repeat protein
MKIENILTKLNSEYTSITDLITTKYNFSDDPRYWTITSDDYDNDESYLGWADVVKIQLDGKILVAGQAGLYDSAAANPSDRNYTVIKRFNKDGTLDESFTSPKFSGSYDGYIRDISQQSTGKLIVVGHFTRVNGSSKKRVVRLNEDGSVDSTFTIGDGFNSSALKCVVLEDDKIVIGGNFSDYDENSCSYIVKLGVNGSMDTVFSSNFSPNGYVFEIKEDSNNKLYVGGQFNKKIVRLNSDGTIDNAFDVGTGFNSRVSSIEFQANSKLVVGGWFTSFDGSDCNLGIVRLETTGELDESFSCTGTGLESWDDNNVQSLKIQSDGKIVVGGWFIGYNGAKQGRIIRLNSNGTKDSSFVTGFGFSDRVQRIVIDSNGYIFCAGFFYSYNGMSCTEKFNYLYSGLAGGCVKLSPTGRLYGSSMKQNISPVGISDGGKDVSDDSFFFNTNVNQVYDGGEGSVENTRLSLPFTHSVMAICDASYGEEYMIADTALNDLNYNFGPMDGKVVGSSDYFGEGSRYFTNMYPGLFVLGVSNLSVNEFSLSGNTGQDGSGNANSGTINLTVRGNDYCVFYKTCYGSSTNETSLNQLIIVNGTSEGLSQVLYTKNQTMDQIITGLSGRKELYSLIYAREDGVASTQEEISGIVVKFLSLFTKSNAIVTTCVSQPCEASAFKCLVKNDSCTCTKLKRSKDGYIPSIVVCGQRLF